MILPLRKLAATSPTTRYRCGDELSGSVWHSRTEEKSMKSNVSAPRDVDEYIAGFPNEVRTILEKIRVTIRKAAPGAQEKISYRIPTVTLDGKYLIYFAAFQKHVGIYPAPRGADEFQEELARYGGGKGTVQFPFDK